MARSNPRHILNRLEANDEQLITELTSLVIAISSRSRLPDHLDSSDIAQEVLTCLLEKLRSGGFRGECSVRTLVYRMAKNVCFTRYRELKAMEYAAVEIDSLIDEKFQADTRLLARETRLVAARVLRSLPDRCRKLWRIMFWGDRNYRLAAQLLGVKEVTVRERMSRCRKLAREMAMSIEKEGNIRVQTGTKQ
jgi:RNA polymerase sigma factor (sigma-70 family)